MASSSRNRSACDRCHSQKLRCAKQPGNPACARCLKAGARCNFSPAGTLATPGFWNAPERTVTPVFDWMLGAQTPFDFNSFLSPASPGVNLENCQSTDNPQVSSLQRLTKILLDADDLYMRLPLQTTLHAPQTQADMHLMHKLPDAMATNTLMERFFDLVQQLIDVYPVALEASLCGRPQPDPGCVIVDCTHNASLPTSLQRLEDQVMEHSRLANPELSLTSLVFSCHMRLLDILDRLFLMITACTRVTLANRHEPVFELSETRVGSFVPKRSAAALMQIVLLGHLVAGLADRVLLMGRAISDFATTGTGRDGDELVLLQSQHKLLTNRQKTKSEQASAVEDFLKHFDFQTLR